MPATTTWFTADVLFNLIYFFLFLGVGVGVGVKWSLVLFKQSHMAWRTKWHEIEAPLIVP